MVINGIGNNLSNEDFLMKFAVFKKKKWIHSISLHEKTSGDLALTVVQKHRTTVSIFKLQMNWCSLRRRLPLINPLVLTEHVIG